MDWQTALYCSQIWQQRLAAQQAAQRRQRLVRAAGSVVGQASGVRWTDAELARLRFYRWLVETGHLSEG